MRHRKTPAGWWSSMAGFSMTATPTTTSCPIGCGSPGQARGPPGRTLSCPYSLTTNDSKFGRGVFGSGDDFFAFLRDSFDLLYEEGADRPRMMSVGLHM